MGGPSPPGHIIRDLERLDRYLKLWWDDEKEVFFLLSTRGRETVCHGGPFAPSDINQLFVEAVARGLRARDDGVTIKQRIEASQAKRDASEAARNASHREFCRAQATREVDAANPSFKTHAQGAPGAPTPASLGTRLDGIIGED